MKNFILIVSLSFLFGCKQEIKAPKSINRENVAVESYTINENIVEELLGFPAIGDDIRKVELTAFTLEKVMRNNIHDSKIVDTIYQYKKGSNNFEFYKASDKYILQKFIIAGNELSLKNNIKIGLSKLEIGKLLNVENNKSDTIKVGDLEQNSIVNFIFKNEKLHEILYCGYID